MSKWIVDIHGDIEGDYEIIEEYKEPKTGHWIKKTNGLCYWCECSMCGYKLSKYIYISYIKTTNYCPNCGEKME